MKVLSIKVSRSVPNFCMTITFNGDKEEKQTFFLTFSEYERIYENTIGNGSANGNRLINGRRLGWSRNGELLNFTGYVGGKPILTHTIRMSELTL